MHLLIPTYLSSLGLNKEWVRWGCLSIHCISLSWIASDRMIHFLECSQAASERPLYIAMYAAMLWDRPLVYCSASFGKQVSMDNANNSRAEENVFYWKIEWKHGNSLFLTAVYVLLTSQTWILPHYSWSRRVEMKTSDWLDHIQCLTCHTTEETHKLNKCDQRAHLQFSVLWISLQLNTAAASAELHPWHL